MQNMRYLRAVLSVLLALFLLSISCAAVSAEEEDPLYEKSILFVGDSICEAICEQGTGRAVFGWAGRIMENHSMTGKNLGYSGASVSDCRGSNVVIAQLQREAAGGYDFVIMHGGVNDAWDSAPVGVMTEGFDGPFDTSTFGGGLETMISYAKETFPDAQLGYIINFRLPGSTIGRLSDMSEYVDLTIAICEKWGVPYLDLYHDDDFNNNVMKVETLTYLKDYIHPTPEGYDVITPYVEEWVLDLASPEPEPEPEPVSSEEPSEEAPSEETSVSEDGSSGVQIFILVLSIVVFVAAVALLIFTVLRKRGSKS